MINPLDFLNHLTILLIVKWMIVAGLTLYTFFAFLIAKQIKVMNKAVSTQYGYFIYGFGLFHFFAALTVLILAILIL